MDNSNRLEELFSHFPGIGPRQAKRFVYYLLNKSPSYISELTKLIDEVRKSTRECDNCHRFFFNDKGSSTSKSCNICGDADRDHSVLMIVARDSDFEVIEKSNVYRGLYFILGGTIPLLDKEPEKRIRLEKLLQHVSNIKNLKEVILSLNTTPEGDHTADIVKDAVKKILKNEGVKITLLGRGLSTGSELEYADSETIKNALQNRA